LEQPNFTYINSLSRGDKAFEAKLVAVIKAEFPIEKAAYVKNINKKNYKEAAESVHKLKHKISILGLEKSYEIAVDYENSLKEDSFKLKEEFENILQSITDYLTKL